MKTTYRMMGIADYITLCNGLLGTAAILFIILAVEDLHQPYYQGGLKTHYIWLAMLCILASVIGDIIDGPIARRYSKRKLLGGSLDIMSDCISFCVAPALLIFVMFGRWGEASPFWTISLGIASCWIIATGMLRLARFQYDDGSEINYFVGLSSPGNALLLLSFAGLIWIQPSVGFGPDLTTWDCSICFGKGTPKPYFDFMMLPLMFISGGLMIADRPMSKLKGGLPMKLSVIQLSAMLVAITSALIHTTKSEHGHEMEGLNLSFYLFIISALLVLAYIISGKQIVERPKQIDDSVSSEE
ncbi:MAG: CDP-alcohol phosphatidyltransferase family protein [Candidatus Poseidoniaceae archaeon]